MTSNRYIQHRIRKAFEQYKATNKVRPIILEGGNAFPDVGVIHKDEIPATIHWMEQKFGMKDLENKALGSVGKSEYSGDIDLAVELDPKQMKAFSEKIRKSLGAENVTGVAGNVSIRVPIQKYDEAKDGRQPRTGYVQVDFIPGEPEWMKTFYHSPDDASKFKGTHRNHAMATAARLVDAEKSEETDDLGRPLEVIRWQFGAKSGFVRVKKTSRRNEHTGGWVKKQDTEIIGKEIRDPKKIAKILFKGKAGPEAMNSMESIIEAVKKAYSKEEVEEFYKGLAQSLSNAGGDLISGYDIPKEILRYVDQ